MDGIAYLPLVVAIPLGAGFLAPLAPRKAPRVADAVGMMAAVALLALVILLFGTSGRYWVGGWETVGIELVLDGLSWLMLAVVAGITLCVVIYSTQYMDKYTARGKFYGLFFLMVAGMCGVVVTGDLFNMYVFLEIAAISSYALVAFGCEAEELEASFKYAVLGSVASSMILLALALLYSQFGTVNLGQLAGKIAATAGTREVLVFSQVLMVAGFGLKAALIPFHAWLPDAHPSAPAPVSAMLSGVLIKAIGVYALARLVFGVFGLSTEVAYALMVLAALSIVGGGILALAQWDFKRLLAYSSISQIGYVVLGLALGTPLGVLAGLYHLVNHSVFKSLLFLNAGAVEHATGTRRLDEMGGLRERMPVTAATSMVASMSIAGIPPLNGFFSKLLVIVACVHAGRYGFALFAVIGSILALAYQLKVQKYAFFGTLGERWKQVREVPFMMSLAMLILAVACLGLSLLVLPGLRETVLTPAGEALLSGVAGRPDMAGI